MTEAAERMLPLYEGKMGHQFDHRFATFTGIGDTDLASIDHLDPDIRVLPRYWVAEAVTHDRLARRTFGTASALLGHRRVARSNDERTSIAALLPWGAASYGWIISAGPDASALACLLGAYNSLVYDYCLRNSLTQPSVPQGTSEQVPVPSPEVFQAAVPWEAAATGSVWVAPRILELTYTAWDVQEFADALGDVGSPFQWDESRRTQLRAELDAAFFHLYGVARDDVDYILDTFPIVRRKDEADFGEYRTKRLILEAYDAMADAAETGVPYQSPLDPPPGQGPRHPPRAS